MAGACILQQILTLAVVMALIHMLETLRRQASFSPAARQARKAFLTILGIAWFGCALSAVSGVPSTRFMLLFLLLSALDAIMLVDAFMSARIVADRPTDTLNDFSNTARLTDSRIGGRGTLATWILAVMVTCPSLTAIILFWPVLSAQHPVAAALTSLVDVSHNVSTAEALQAALFGTMTSCTVLAALTIDALMRKRPVLSNLCSGLTRLGPPIVICLTLAYVVSLNRTILLDAEASRAISDAAKNDLQWVLTHSGEAPNS
jgi:hypothetical protein